MHDAVIADLVLDDWYLTRYPEIAGRALSPLAHYRRQGWREGRQPNPYFDPPFYLARCGQHVPAGDPLLDYVRRGEPAGQRPCAQFDPIWYRQTYHLPPSQNALADFLYHLQDPQAPLRLPCRERELIAHTGLFDADFYLFAYEDVRRAEIDPLGHFLASRAEHRKPNIYFDTEWYCTRTGDDAPCHPLTHYILRGEALGYRPGPYFDPVWYKQKYKLDESVCALGHYLAHRKTQLYAPNPEFDLEAYRPRLRPDRDPFLHFLATSFGCSAT